MKRFRQLLRRRVWAALAAACGVALQAAQPPRALRDALASITAEDLLRHITVLASDEFEGRAPGTPGEEKTVAYLSKQFARLGLEPGNPDGT
jgi:hypothetical protein